MKLSHRQLGDILGILEKIDRGLVPPRVADRVGRFFRQYQSGRRELDMLLAQRVPQRRSDGALSGRALGPIEVHTLTQPEVDVLSLPLGEVAGTVVISEQLGGLLNLRLWLKAHAANAAFNKLGESASLCFEGDYRWTPLAKLTPGEADVLSAGESVTWQGARCLKAVADDLLRPPQAVEYILDYRMGPPGLKFFRTVCAIRRNDQWEALPCFGNARNFEISAKATEATLADQGLFLLLVYREPWSNSWTIVRGTPVEAAEVIAHAMSWAHYRAELSGESFEMTTVAAAREALRACGVKTVGVGRPNLNEHLLPVAKEVLRSVRRLG